MRVTSPLIKLASFALGAFLRAAAPALAIGVGTDVVLIRQDPDGELWYSYEDSPGIKLFIHGQACWVDHDHIRPGGIHRAGCIASRP